MAEVNDAAVKYNEHLLKSVEKMKEKNNYYSSMTSGSKIYNATTGTEYGFLSGSRGENTLWKIIVADKGLALYYDSPEEWLRHKKKQFRYEVDDLKSKDNVVLWYEPSEEEVISMKANGKKKVPKYLPKINPAVKSAWEYRRQVYSN